MANKLTTIIAGVLIAVAILLGLFALILGRRPAPRPADANKPVATASTPIVVASTPLAPGRPITVDQLKVQQMAVAPAGAFANPASAVGRVPANPIPANAPVVESGLTSGLADQLEPGERAVAVKVDDISAVGNRIRPGNYVDVFVDLHRDNVNGIAPPPGAGGKASLDIPVSQARLLLSRIRVLQFGDATPDRDAGANAGASRNVEPQGVHAVILAVPTADVDTLTVAQTSGKLSLALRSPLDEDVASAPVAVPAGSPDFADPSARAAAGVALSVLSDNLAGGQGRTAAPPPHSRARAHVAHAAAGSLEVIRGGRAETVAY